MPISPLSQPADARRSQLLPHQRFLRAAHARRVSSGKGLSLLGLLPLLMSLALIPALLLIWFHLGDLHYLEIVSLSAMGAASLGVVLLLGLIMLAYMMLYLTLPSVFIALAVAQYGPGNVPKAAVGAWASSGGLLAVAWFIFAQNPNFNSTVMFWSAHLAAGVLIGAWTLCAAYPRANSQPATSTTVTVFLRSPLVLGIGNGICGLLAFVLLAIPIKHLADDQVTGPLPDWGQAALPLLLAFLISLSPGLLYMWSNRIGSRGMNKWQLMVLMLTAAFIMLMTSYSASREVRHLTLIAAGIVGNPTSPRLHRLPDSWNEQDKAMVATAFKNNSCPVDGDSQSAAGAAATRWLCGYQNFSFGRARLICNRAYMGVGYRFANKNLTCVLYIDNTLASLVVLPPPGPVKPVGKVTTTAPSPGSP
ncbi:hypothetical protein ADE_15630 [Achromobacter denitrificans]|uniref:hypothetical protein n=1 Tax=Achromobacter denitrificans TaxID=32002 RepID=UPI00166BC665|nr:hypothetical protein [Achromobacter denitrificans]GFN25865.1 hypothetical protein ADE_15630 [Achromobacter denitrificans]